jgi:hypothetical protein
MVFITIHHHGNSLQDSYRTSNAFSFQAGMYIVICINTLCIVQKDLSFLLQNLQRKVHFCMQCDWWHSLKNAHSSIGLLMFFMKLASLNQEF